jgi:ribosomal protein S17E
MPYKKIYTEQFEPEKDDADTRKQTIRILQALKKDSFSNKETRQLFMHHLVGLTISNDPIARKTINKITGYISSIADEMLKEIKEGK